MIERLLAAGLALLLTGAVGAGEPPLGSKHIYPSADRPVGFRGDGNGYFPGATPVAEWREGTVVFEKRGPVEVPVLADRKGHNVVWKVEMPSWANSQPTVVGDLVFTTAEPNRLVCADAQTGQVRWVAAANPWELRGVAEALANRTQALYDVWREAIPRYDAMRGAGTMTRTLPAAEFNPIAEAFVDKVLPRVVKELKAIDPDGPYEESAAVTASALREYGAALVASEKPGYDGPPPAGKHDPINGRMSKLADVLAKRIEGVAGTTGAGRGRYANVPLAEPWGHLIEFAAAAPVSDGRHVFASFGQGQTVCHDLSGRRVWGVQFTPEPDETRTTALQSPLLAGDVLVDVHGGRKLLRGLDKRTGKVVWEAPTKGAGIKDGGGYYVGNHKVVRLPYRGKPVDVIVTTLGNVIRAADGKVLGRLPFEYPASGGPSVVSAGDVVVKGAVGDNYRTPLIAYRLKFDGADAVTADEVWRTPRRSTPGYQSMAMTPAALFMDSATHTALNPATGKVLMRGSGRQAGGFSNLVAGRVWVWADDGSRLWGGRGAEVFGSFGTADVSDPGRQRVLSTRNVLGGANRPRLPVMERLAPELYAMTGYTGKTYGWPAHFLHADTAVFPSGNRLFIRSVSHLYCIGDPAVPFDWDPSSRPADLTRALPRE